MAGVEWFQTQIYGNNTFAGAIHNNCFLMNVISSEHDMGVWMVCSCTIKAIEV
jgi:hypothetical protein